jgi:acyl carrier protein
MSLSIEDRLREYMVEEMMVDPPPGDDEMLVERGFVASARLLDLVGFIETEFRVELQPRDVSADNLVSIGTIAIMIRRRQSAT